MRKAQGMSLNVIIIAVIALIVLVVLVLIFTGKVKLFGSSTSETASKYSGSACEVPGTNNECGLSATECKSKGGYVDTTSTYSDCYSGCCLK